MNRNDQPPPSTSTQMFVEQQQQQQQQPIRFVAYHDSPPPSHHPAVLQIPPPPPPQQHHHPYSHQQQHHPPSSFHHHQSSARHPMMQPPPATSSSATTVVSMQQQQQRPVDGGGIACCLPSPMPITPQQQTDQTVLWGMQNYVLDSGFQSRATASLVSTAYSNLTGVTGIDRDRECGGAYPTGPAGPSGYVTAGQQQQQQQLGQQQFLQQQQQQQSAALMYPADAQGELRQVITAMPHLAKMLRDDDGDLHSAKSAAFMVHNLVKDPVKARVIIRSSDLIDALVVAMRSGMDRRDDELLKSTTGIFYTLSNTDEIKEEGLEVIYSSGAIPLLIRLLSGESDFEAVLYYSTTIVHNLLFHPKAMDVIRALDAVPSLVGLLSRNHDKFLAIVTDCLRKLCSSNAEAQMKACDGAGPSCLIRILEHSNYETVLWTTARLLQVLGTIHCCKQTIVEAGGIRALARHLAHPSHRLVLGCLEALRNLSDKAMYVEEGVESLLGSLIQNLGSSDEKVVQHCVSILYNLTCKNSTNKAFVCGQMGIESLARTLNERWFHPQIVEDILGVLRHLTCKWANVRDARNKLRSIGCLPLVGQYLRVNKLPGQFAQHPGVVIEALALTRNLTMDGGASWPDFRQYDIVKATGNLAIVIQDMINYVVDHDPPKLKQCLEMLEWALLTMAGLCQDDANRQILLTVPNIEQLAVKFKNHPLSARSLTEAADKCLSELRKNNVLLQPADQMQQQQDPGGYPFVAADPTTPAGHYHQVQSGSSTSYGAGGTAFDSGGLYDHQQQQQHHQQPMAMPSPLPWEQQHDSLATGPIDYDNAGEYYGMAMDFDPYDDSGRGGSVGGGGAGPGPSSSNMPGPSTYTTADEMNNLRL